MKRKDDLHRLISTMSAAEKGYFKKSAMRHAASGNRYMTLFDMIERQGDSYDETPLRAEFGGNFSRLKNYLYDTLLRSLSAFRNENDPSLQFLERLGFVRVLVAKELYEQALELLAGLKEEAGARDLYPEQLLVTDLEAQILYTLSTTDMNYLSKTTQAAREQEEHAALVYEAYRYKRLYREIFELHIMHSTAARSEEELKVFRAYLGHPLFRDDAQPGSFRAATMYYATRSMLCQYTFDDEGAYENQKKLVEILRTREMDQSCFVAVHNHVYACMQVLRFDEAEENLFLLREILASRSEFRGRAIFVLSSELLLLYRRHRYGELIALEDRIDVEHYGYNNVVVEQMTLVAFAYFCLGRTEEALDRFSRIINNTDDLNISTGKFAFISIFRLLLHFEKGDFDYVESLARSLYRKLRKQDRLHRLERIVIEGLGRLLRAHSESERMTVFASIRGQLTELYHDPIEGHFSKDLAPLILWLESRIEQRPFRGMMKVGAAEDSPGVSVLSE